MKDILETLTDVQPLSQYLNYRTADSSVDEGLKDILKSIKDKFVNAIQWAFGWAVRLSSKFSYWLAADDDGNVLPAITPLTAGQAYADGAIDKTSTFVNLRNSAAAKATGCKTNLNDAEKLYGPGNTLDYWKRMLKESKENGWTLNTVNEVKLQNSDPQAKYNVVDNPGLIKAIEIALKNKKLCRLLIYGAPGIGKTAILREILKSYPQYGGKDGLVVKTLSNETPENFTLPKYVVVDGQDKATDVPKTWMPVYKPTGDPTRDQVLDDACGKGLLFIDELSRAQPQVLNVILPLINEGEFNGYKIGSGWAIICASNRVEDEMSGQAEIGNALSNRFRTVYYEPTAKTWSEWARKQGYISPVLLSWLNLPASESMSGGKYFYWDPNEDGSNDVSKIMCTPRSWDNAMKTLCEYWETASLEGWSILDIPRDIIGCALNQCVPAEAVDSFLAFIDVISKIGNMDAFTKDIWKNAGKGSKHLDFKKDKELKKVAVPIIQIIITSHAKSLPSEEEYKNLCSWIVSTGSDQLASYMCDVFKNIYAAMLASDGRSNKAQDSIFKLKNSYVNFKAKGQNDKIKVLEVAYSKFLETWGETLETLPNWIPGQKLLAQAFGDKFAAAIVDGAEGLG